MSQSNRMCFPAFAEIGGRGGGVGGGGACHAEGVLAEKSFTDDLAHRSAGRAGGVRPSPQEHTGIEHSGKDLAR
ncbi:hypothetical protein GCM10017559_61270 [Streptosporangium longisporum]|uniref:Uncharacterized protein n=1 Tax=Streptosporangium longisporum TaxID=46187 RepID=A0ABP6KYD2_9ACTN